MIFKKRKNKKEVEKNGSHFIVFKNIFPALSLLFFFFFFFFFHRKLVFVSQPNDVRLTSLSCSKALNLQKQSEVKKKHLNANWTLIYGYNLILIKIKQLFLHLSIIEQIFAKKRNKIVSRFKLRFFLKNRSIYKTQKSTLFFRFLQVNFCSSLLLRRTD